MADSAGEAAGAGQSGAGGAALPAPAAVRLRALLAAVLGGGVLATGVSLASALSGADTITAVAVLATVLAVAAGDVSLMHIRFGSNSNSFTWAEASVILGATLVGWSWLVVIGTATVLVRQLLIGRARLKAAYNAASFALGVLLAQVTAFAVTGSWQAQAPSSPRSIVALAAAAAVYFLWISLAVSAVVALSQNLSIRPVYARGFSQRLVMFLGNSAVGLLVVSLGSFNPATILGTLFFLVLLYFSYSGYLLAKQDRNTWRDLSAASAGLNSVDAADVARSLSSSLSTLLGAEYVEVAIRDGAALSRNYVAGQEVFRASGAEGRQLPAWMERVADSTVHIRAATANEPERSELEELGLATAVLAPLVASGVTLGAVRMGFRGRVDISAREQQMLSTLTNHAAVALQNARLFEEVTAQRTRLSGIVENTSDGIFVVDRAGAVREWNPAMERMTGRTAAQVTGLPLNEALRLAPADADLLHGNWVRDRLLADGDFEISLQLDTGGGGLRDVALALAAMRSSDGRYDAAVGVARDVTGAREADLAKQDFIATVSHELRTPLTPIKGYLMMLMRPNFSPAPDVVRTYHARMLEQAEQLERLVDDLLSASQLTHGTFRVTAGEVDVSVLVRELTASSADHSGRIWEYDYRPNSVPPAWCDGTRLAQVVSNLLSNADKFSPADQPVCVSVEADGPEIRITVADRGPGVPDASHELIFEPFRRLGDPLTRTTRGTGLGLHIARRLVTAMEGRVWVENRPGGGSAFVVTVPVAQDPAAEDPAVEVPAAKEPAAPEQAVVETPRMPQIVTTPPA